MASGCANGGLGWIFWKISSQKGLSRAGTGSQGTGGVPSPGGISQTWWVWRLGHGSVMALPGLGCWLESTT